MGAAWGCAESGEIGGGPSAAGGAGGAGGTVAASLAMDGTEPAVPEAIRGNS